MTMTTRVETRPRNKRGAGSLSFSPARLLLASLCALLFFNAPVPPACAQSPGVAPTRPGSAAAKRIVKTASGVPRSATAGGANPTIVTLGGYVYVDIVAYAKTLGLTAAWTKPAEQVVLKSAWSRIELKGDSSEWAVNGMRVFSGLPVRMYKRSLWISRIDFENLFLAILNPGQGQLNVPALRTIAIDAGHGGKDKGKINDRLKIFEKTVALDTAQRLKLLLERQGYKVVMTRTGDKYIDLADRPEIAARAGADLFISVHFNSVEQGAQRVSGIEVYRFTPRYQSPITRTNVETADKLANPADVSVHWSAVAGYLMQREMLRDLQAPDRGFKHHKWAVLRLSKCPAILVEAGFLSNDAEARKVAMPAYRQKIAEAIADGVKAYAAALAGAKK